jgi:hypothetical protein
MQTRDRVLQGNPMPLVYQAATGLTVEAFVLHATSLTSSTLSLSEIPTAAGHVKLYVGSITPSEAGWYYVTFRSAINSETVATDATRFYCYTLEEEATGGALLGTALVTEAPVKLGHRYTITYKGRDNLDVIASILHQEDLEFPERAVEIPLTKYQANPGYQTVYTGSYLFLREGNHFVSFKTDPAGGEQVVKLLVFRADPANRATGSVISTATSRVL